MRDSGLDALLDLDGQIIAMNDSAFVKFDVKLVEVTPYRPHGIKYSLTLHDKHGQRLIGFDNAHAIKQPKKGFRGKKIEYDHKHRHQKDTGVTYTFTDPAQLITDFWAAVDGYLGEET